MAECFCFVSGSIGQRHMFSLILVFGLNYEKKMVDAHSAFLCPDVYIVYVRPYAIR